MKLSLRFNAKVFKKDLRKALYVFNNVFYLISHETVHKRRLQKRGNSHLQTKLTENVQKSWPPQTSMFFIEVL